MLGLKKGTISFIERNEEWDTIAQREIEHLKVLFGPVAKDVQQIGSGAISNPSFRVKFMPILDIAVAVSSFDDVTDMEYKLKAHHIYHVYHKMTMNSCFLNAVTWMQVFARRIFMLYWKTATDGIIFCNLKIIYPLIRTD